jgi:ferrochelatase
VRYIGDEARSQGPGGTAVLLVNLGTPEAPTSGAVRRYLAEFLWDPRVVEIPRPVWWLLLYGIVLPTRSRSAAAAYRKIWTAEGSPLLVYSQRQRDAVAAALVPGSAGDLSVELAMRYGQPSIPDVLAKLRAARVQRLLVLPLYPQYCGVTTGSAFDAVSAELTRWRRVPALRFVADYHDHPRYVAALAQSVRDHWSQHGRGERLLFSFHGIPARNVAAGDPYEQQCLATARLVAQALALPPERWAVSYQSRLGRAQWLQPYTVELLPAWARESVREVDVISPGFAADCIETLEEIAIRYREDFVAAGGGALRYIPALNERRDHVEFLVALISEQLQGWRDAETGSDPRAPGEERTPGERDERGTLQELHQ